jgi:4,5-dihydroxyphthalate decarboxylase
LRDAGVRLGGLEASMNRRAFLETAGFLALARTGAAAATPKLTLAGADYLRFTPLATGDFRPKDIDLTWIRGDRSEMLRRAATDPSIDGGEASMLQHLVRVDRDDRSLVALPVFPLRNFTARDIYIRKGDPLSASDLRGRRVGVYSWAASGSVWYRHLLRHLGQDPAKMTWIVGGVDSPAKASSVAPFPAHVLDAAAGRSIVDLLLSGEVDAVFAPIPPKKYHPLDGPVVRLVPDFRSLEKRYFEETRCYPPQHVIVVRKEIWERDPSIGRRLVAAFDECEERFQANQHLFPYGSPWLIAEVEETDLAMGRGHFAHGLEKNRSEVDVFCRSAFEDGLTKRRVAVDEFFAEFLAA